MSWKAKILEIVGGPVFDRVIKFIPNHAERERVLLEMENAVLENVGKVDLAQAEIARIEAQHQSIFVAGARPALLWVCVFGLCWGFVLEPFLSWCLLVFGYTGTLPELETERLLQLTMSMIGLSAMRMREKEKGVAREYAPKAFKKDKKK